MPIFDLGYGFSISFGFDVVINIIINRGFFPGVSFPSRISPVAGSACSDNARNSKSNFHLLPK